MQSQFRTNINMDSPNISEVHTINNVNGITSFSAFNKSEDVVLIADNQEVDDKALISAVNQEVLEGKYTKLSELDEQSGKSTSSKVDKQGTKSTSSQSHKF